MNGNKQNNQQKKQTFCEAYKKIEKKDLLKWIIIAVVGFSVLVLVFGAGIFVGGMRARFSYRWAENYHKNFGGPQMGFLKGGNKGFLQDEFIEGYGAFGEIIKLNDNGFVIKGRGDMEKVIIIKEDTVIKKGQETIKDNLKVGDGVVVIGEPNEQGQIQAKLIRIFNGQDLRKPIKFPLPLPF